MPFFLFTLILFSGTLLYGQGCPVAVDQNLSDPGIQQYFCDATIPEVQHLQASGTDVVWYADQTATTPLPDTQLLATNTVYYAGNSSASCAGSRSEVTVTIYSQPEILGIYENKSANTKQSLPTLSFCVADVNNPNIYLSNIRTNADDSGTIQWYDGKNSTTVLPADTELVNGTTYWVDQANPYGSCRTNRQSVKIELISEPAPTGAAEQTFCAANNPTLGDIVTNSDNRYYVSATSVTELSVNTPLVDGKTYYLSAVGTECNSVDRLAVTVTVTPLTVVDETQNFCDSDNPTVADLAPAGGTWYADNTFSTPLDPTEALVHSADYFLELEDGSCTTTRAIASISRAPNAGTPTSGLTYCANDPAFDLFNEILGNPDTGGTFEPALTGNLFDPAEWGVGTHDFTYTVAGDDYCEDAVNTISVTVSEAPDAGEPVSDTYCSADFATGDDLIAEFNTFIADRDQTGTFTPTLESLGADFDTNPVGTFSTTYTLTTGSCTDSVDFTITVNQSPDAGTSATYQLIEGDNTVVDLFTALDGSPATGGEWTAEDGTVVSGNFDPAVDVAPATYTYTVNANGCESSATVFVAEACPIVADTTPEFCETVDNGSGADFPRVSDLLPSHAVWYASADTSDNTPIDPTTELEDQAVYYAGNASSTCTARTAVTVTILDSPNAGVDTPVEVCANDPEFDLVSMIDPSILGAADTNGTINPPLASGTFMFNPAVDVAGDYTYTVASTTACADASVTITVTINAVPGAPATSDVEECASVGLTVADLPATPDAGNTVQWYTDAALTTPAAATDVLVSGNYYVTQMSPAGCESAASTSVVTINDAPTPTMVAGGSTFCMVDEPTIGDIAMNDSNVTWYDAPTGGNILSPSELLVSGTTYYASLTDTASGCESSQRLPVTAELEKCPLPIPEAFSPNGDQINDVFEVNYIAEQYPDFTIKIFNRWGQPVFKGNASNSTWNGVATEGSLGSKEVPVGVYFYVIEYNDGETKPTQGRLYLTR